MSELRRARHPRRDVIRARGYRVYECSAHTIDAHNARRTSKGGSTRDRRPRRTTQLLPSDMERPNELVPAHDPSGSVPAMCFHAAAQRAQMPQAIFISIMSGIRTLGQRPCAFVASPQRCRASKNPPYSSSRSPRDAYDAKNPATRGTISWHPAFIGRRKAPRTLITDFHPP